MCSGMRDLFAAALVATLLGACGTTTSRELVESEAPGPALQVCELEECGSMPDMKATTCPGTGIVAGPTGRCMRAFDGECGWELMTCDSGSSITGID